MVAITLLMGMDARKAEGTSRKTTPLIAAGRPVRHLQEVTDNIAAMRVVRGFGTLSESKSSAKTADIAFVYSAAPAHLPPVQLTQRLSKQASRKKTKQAGSP